MKLKKREITLNEADSLQDMYYLEKSLLGAYERGIENAAQKQTVNELNKGKAETEKEMAFLFSLWEKSKKEQL